MRIRRTLFLIAFLLMLAPMSFGVSYDPEPAAILPEKNMIVSAESLTLRPDGDIWTNLTRSGGSFNYEMVDEVSHDSDGTTNSHNGPPATWDRYTLEDHTSELGIITNLIVYYYAKKTGTGTAYRSHGIADSTDSTQSGGIVYTDLSYTQFSVTYSTKPSGGAWQWSDVDDAQVMIAMYGSPVPLASSFLTQVYVVVNYEAGIAYEKDLIESISANDTAFETEGGRPEAWILNNIIEFFFPVRITPSQQFGYDSFFIFLGLIMIPVSTMYLVRGGRKGMNADKFFYGVIIFVLGIGFLIGGIMP